MNDVEDVLDYSAPVYKVLQEPNQVAGVGVIPAMFILVLTIVLMTMVSIWFILLGIFLYIIAKTIVKKDPYMLTVLFERVMQPNEWRI